MALHENIKQLRELKKWSQEEMALKINMSKNGYAKIERGESKPNLDRLQQIAQVFDIDLVQLIQSDSKGIVCLISENSQQILNYFGDSQSFTAKIEKLEMSVQHLTEMLAQKDTLLQEKEREINTLNDLVAALKK